MNLYFILVKCQFLFLLMIENVHRRARSLSHTIKRKMQSKNNKYPKKVNSIKMGELVGHVESIFDAKSFE